MNILVVLGLLVGLLVVSVVFTIFLQESDAGWTELYVRDCPVCLRRTLQKGSVNRRWIGRCLSCAYEEGWYT